MDTKSKTHNTALVIVGYFLSVYLLVACVLFGITFYANQVYQEDYSNTPSFHDSVNTLLSNSIYALSLDVNGDLPYLASSYMEQELQSWDGVQVYIRSEKTGIEYTNTTYQNPQSFSTLAGQKNQFTLTFDGSKITVMKSGQLQPDLGGTVTSRTDLNPVSTSYLYGFGEGGPFYDYDISKNYVVITIPDIEALTSFTDNLSFSSWSLYKSYLPIVIVLFVCSLSLLVFLHLKRRQLLKMCGLTVAWAIKKIPFELKYSIGLTGIFVCISLVSQALYYSRFDPKSYLFMFPLLFALVVLQMMWWDLHYNGLATFGVNIPTTLYRMVKSSHMRYPFQKKIQRQFIALFSLLLICGVSGLFLFFFAYAAQDIFWLVIALCFLACCVVLMYKLVSDYFETISQLGNIIGHINTISKGELDVDIPVLRPIDDLYPLFYAVQGMKNSVQTAVDVQLQSEKMKIDLITNVSHDLKTPLTSIVTYTDLLKREQLTPLQREFVDVIDSKSQRLKALMSDIFDLSKASSGNMELHMQRLCINHLLSQAVAENEEILQSAGITPILNKAEEFYIEADGQRLYRVFENLLINISKYAMTGSRAYIDIVPLQGRVSVVFKNTSSYPMNFTGEQMKERFVQGDLSRNTDGSGLGLAISDSFTQLMDGRLDVVVDGDLFKAIITFPLSETQS